VEGGMSKIGNFSPKIILIYRRDCRGFYDILTGSEGGYSQKGGRGPHARREPPPNYLSTIYPPPLHTTYPQVIN